MNRAVSSQQRKSIDLLSSVVDYVECIMDFYNRVIQYHSNTATWYEMLKQVATEHCRTQRSVYTFQQSLYEDIIAPAEAIVSARCTTGGCDDVSMQIFMRNNVIPLYERGIMQNASDFTRIIFMLNEYFIELTTFLLRLNTALSAYVNVFQPMESMNLQLTGLARSSWRRGRDAGDRRSSSEDDGGGDDDVDDPPISDNGGAAGSTPNDASSEREGDTAGDRGMDVDRDGSENETHERRVAESGSASARESLISAVEKKIDDWEKKCLKKYRKNKTIHDSVERILKLINIQDLSLFIDFYLPPNKKIRRCIMAAPTELLDDVFLVTVFKMMIAHNSNLMYQTLAFMNNIDIVKQTILQVEDRCLKEFLQFIISTSVERTPNLETESDLDSLRVTVESALLDSGTDRETIEFMWNVLKQRARLINRDAYMEQREAFDSCEAEKSKSKEVAIATPAAACAGLPIRDDRACKSPRQNIIFNVPRCSNDHGRTNAQVSNPQDAVAERTDVEYFSIEEKVIEQTNRSSDADALRSASTTPRYNPPTGIPERDVDYRVSLSPSRDTYAEGNVDGSATPQQYNASAYVSDRGDGRVSLSPSRDRRAEESTVPDNAPPSISEKTSDRESILESEEYIDRTLELLAGRQLEAEVRNPILSFKIDQNESGQSYLSGSAQQLRIDRIPSLLLMANENGKFISGLQVDGERFDTFPDIEITETFIIGYEKNIGEARRTPGLSKIQFSRQDSKLNSVLNIPFSAVEVQLALFLKPLSFSLLSTLIYQLWNIKISENLDSFTKWVTKFEFDYVEEFKRKIVDLRPIDFVDTVGSAHQYIFLSLPYPFFDYEILYFFIYFRNRYNIRHMLKTLMKFCKRTNKHLKSKSFWEGQERVSNDKYHLARFIINALINNNDVYRIFSQFQNDADIQNILGSFKKS